MKDRIAELAESVKRWAREAGAEWGESYKDSPPSHLITFLVGVALATAARWVL